MASNLVKIQSDDEVTRLQNCPVNNESKVKEVNRSSDGDFIFENVKILTVLWYDNKIVIASNLEIVQSEDEVTKCDSRMSDNFSFFVVDHPDDRVRNSRET
ncbi:hypothetical protein HHI36_022265 [Cryptolaemus montrouzieri]|uniref:Uncharacterized protein n=1 Tax=Cryptolaemus montrouzieri TaxID=559131 RepID=A0ABD2MZK1_9CUCU